MKYNVWKAPSPNQQPTLKMITWEWDLQCFYVRMLAGMAISSDRMRFKDKIIANIAKAIKGVSIFHTIFDGCSKLKSESWRWVKVSCDLTWQGSSAFVYKIRPADINAPCSSRHVSVTHNVIWFVQPAHASVNYVRLHLFQNPFFFT